MITTKKITDSTIKNLAKSLFNIKDEAILDAIEYYTTLKSNHK